MSTEDQFKFLLTRCQDYYLLPITTLPRYSISKDLMKLSKKEEWLQIENVPCQIMDINESKKFLILNSFSSSDYNKCFKIKMDELNLFKILKHNNFFLKIDEYPCEINIKEFDNRIEVKKVISKIKQICKINKSPISKFLDDKLSQLTVSQGNNKNSTIKEYKDFKNNQLKIDKTHKRFGDPIFNRNNRWCIPTNMSYEKFELSKSYPAPIGIRPKDFCLPSELILTLKELINQCLHFKNVSSLDYILFKSKLDIIEKRKIHKCKFCNKSLNIDLHLSEYKSRNNYIELCHRNPNDRFLSNNIYFGHGECNRRQGAYTEKERMMDGLSLLKSNVIIDYKEYKELLSKVYNS